MKLSVIIPTINNHTMLLETVTSLNRNKPKLADLEIIVVNQGSDSIQSFLEKDYNVKFIQAGSKSVGFAKACNLGLKAATGGVLFLLNDDVIVPPSTLDHMLRCLDNWERVTKLDKIGIVGPLSNFVAGLQRIRQEVTSSTVDDVAREIEQHGPAAWVPSNFISGFAMMITRQCYEDVGDLDERFPYGHNDTDYVIRAYQAGYYAGIVGNAFIFHWGSETLKRWKALDIPDTRHGMSSEPEFRKKWTDAEFSKPTHLGIVMRVKVTSTPQRDMLERVLLRNSTFADEIFILDDGSSVNITSLVKKYSKVVWFHQQSLELQERRDRNMLVQAAYYWGLENRPNHNRWILSIDADEVYEDKLDRAYLDRLMRPEDPLIWQYMFHWYTFWNSETHWRQDGIWGKMHGSRLFKPWGVEPRLVRGNAVGFHVEHVPLMAGAQRTTSIRVKHYGYVNSKQRTIKHAWYEKSDTDRQPEMIGAEDYSHLIDEGGIKLVRWIEDNGIILMTMVKNEERGISQWLSKYGPFADEIILLDTGSTDRTVELITSHEQTQVVSCNVEPIDTLVGPRIPFDGARNQLLKACHKYPLAWVWHLDIDEDLGDLGWVRRAMDASEVAGYMFYVRNFQKKGDPVLSESIRIFRNTPEFYYTGYIHETLDGCVRKYKHRIQRAAPYLEHLGFLSLTSEEVQRKFEGYIAFELRQIEDFPNDPRPYFNIALHLLEDVKFASDAVGLLEIAAELDPSFHNAQKELALVLAHRAAGHMKNAMQMVPPDHIHRAQMRQIAEQLNAVAGERYSVAPGHVSKFVRHKEMIFKLRKIVEKHKAETNGHKVPRDAAYKLQMPEAGKHVLETSPLQP